jgi:hypothetical protein
LLSSQAAERDFARRKTLMQRRPLIAAIFLLFGLPICHHLYFVETLSHLSLSFVVYFVSGVVAALSTRMGTRRVVTVIGHFAPLVSVFIQGSDVFDLLVIVLIIFAFFGVGWIPMVFSEADHQTPNWQVITPGYYKTNYCGQWLLGLSGVRRLLRLPLAYLGTRTRSKQPAPGRWMPRTWADLECSKRDLSERFWHAIARPRQDFEALGFTELGFKKNRESLNPVIRDNGGVNYIDANRRYFGQLSYVRAYQPAPINAERVKITIVFVAVFQRRWLAYTNGDSLSDVVPDYALVGVPSDDVTTIYRQFSEHLARLTEPPRHFPDDGSLQKWFDSNHLQFFEDEVRARLLIKMTDAEVADARRKLPPPLPNS